MEQSVSAEIAWEAARGFARVPAAIPVLVEIVHVWERTSRRTIPGTLLNVSQGGAGIAIAWAVPPSTRVIVVVPIGCKLRLLAEIVWTSIGPGGDPGSAMYGLRWVEHLPEEYLDSMGVADSDSASASSGQPASPGPA